MKVGMFTDTYFPQVNGVATSVYTLKKNLQALGHQVFVFTTTDPQSQEENHVYRVPSIPFAKICRMGLIYHPGLVRRMTDIGLDLIHTHTEFSMGLFGGVMAKKLHIPHIHTMHTNYEDYTHYLVKSARLDSAAKSLVRRLINSYCTYADQVVVPSFKTKNALMANGLSKTVEVVATGIDLTKYQPARIDSNRLKAVRSELGLKESDRILLYVGRLSQEKNLCQVLKDLAEVIRSHGDLTFVLVGDGPERPVLEDLCRQLHIDRQVIFAGQKPWEDIGLYYQLGDAFISGSQSETQGLTYIEALAAGLPLIARDDPCLQGVLQEGINGFSFSTIEDLHLAVHSLVLKDSSRDRFASQALETAQSFSEVAFAQKIEQIYLQHLSPALDKNTCI